ncbi:LysR family transcriptional regulator [filamentous cyanobacterium CCP5]|nr:LysR family transcriptional regulator [filamentous cyanobacterium CCP5]
MKLSQLRILVAVAEHGSFSEAALELEMSQSAVSHAIATLEEHLGVVLLSRGRHGAQLTPVGQRIVSHAQVIGQRSEAIVKEAELAKGLEGGQVRIAAFRSISTHLLPRVIAQFHERYPAVAVSLAEHDDFYPVEAALHEGRADVGFTFLPTSANLKTWELMQDEFVAIFPGSFRVANDHLSWADLKRLPLIMPPDSNLMTRNVARHMRSFGQDLSVAYEVETDATIINLVVQGLGATILPKLAAEPIPADLQVFPLPESLKRVIGVAILQNALHTPATYAFLETLQNLRHPASVTS